MTQHVFGAVLTARGVAANNRGETEGNTTTLQKLIWRGAVHTTVSAEALRFALRARLAEMGAECNRTFEGATRANVWKDPAFKGWSKDGEVTYADDDLLGFMSAEAAKEENGKGSTKVRRSVLELTRAVSLEPWHGDVTFNAASPGATPSAAKKGTNPVPYATEMHSTRYQYGFALTPSELRDAALAPMALRALVDVGPVAGNQARFLFDFSPDNICFRVTSDRAPRLLYGFDLRDGDSPSLSALASKVRAGDVAANELVIGGPVSEFMTDNERQAFEGAKLYAGVKAACESVCERLAQT
ncbi:MAG: type I-B CRISPR-associated protein Cas7/Cst2/DevR [Myxococcota bacterium]